MFRVEQNVPEVYIENSRDFQLLSRLYDLAFQEARNSALSMNYISDTMRCTANILPLLSTKLGFFTNSDTPDDIYRLVLSAFPHIIKYKGSAKGIQLIVNIFERILNTTVTAEITDEKTVITFVTYYPPLELLQELIEYVRPVGYLVEWHVSILVPVKDYDYAQADASKVIDKLSRENINNILGRPIDDKGNIAIPSSQSTIGFTTITGKDDKDIE